MMRKRDLPLWLSMALALQLHPNLCRAAGSNCKSACSDGPADTASRRCGAWLRYENAPDAAGVYRLQDGALVNLTCAADALPTPAVVEWMHKRHSGAAAVPVSCGGGRRTVHECAGADVNAEHRTTSTCLLRLTSLHQTAHYYCVVQRADQVEGTEGGRKKPLLVPQSVHALIEVYGIDKDSVKVLSFSLGYKQTGHILVEYCGNPKPALLWMNEYLDVMIAEGETSGRFSVLESRHLLVSKAKHDHHRRRWRSASRGTNNLTQSVYHARRFCYSSQLVLGSVEGHAYKKWTVLLANEAATVRVTLGARLYVSNVRKAAGRLRWTRADAARSILITLCLFVGMLR